MTCEIMASKDQDICITFVIVIKDEGESRSILSGMDRWSFIFDCSYTYVQGGVALMGVLLHAR